MVNILVGHKALLGQDKSKIDIKWASVNSVTGHTIGLDMVEFNNSTLGDILRTIDPSLMFSITSSKLRTAGIDLSYTAASLDKATIVREINTGLTSLGVHVREVGVSMPVYQLEFSGTSGCENSPFLNRVKQINRVWEAECIYLSAVARQMMRWYDDIYVTVAEDVIVPKATLHHDDFEIFKRYMEKDDFLFKQLDSSPQTIMQFHYK